MSLYKTGRNAAVRPAALSTLEVYAEGKIPTPPRTVEVPGQEGPHIRPGLYPIDGNDEYGDCTIAGAAHFDEACNLLVAEHDPVPTSEEVVSTYFKLTGGADSGLNEAEVLRTWQREGLFGEQIAAYAPVNPVSLLQLHQSVAFYGGCYLGIECPESAQLQFQNGEPWTYVEGSPIVGGHCVVALGYGPNGGLHCATWGGIAVLEASFLAHFLDEAWVILPHQMVEAKKDALGLNLATLLADLKRV